MSTGGHDQLKLEVTTRFVKELLSVIQKKASDSFDLYLVSVSSSGAADYSQTSNIAVKVQHGKRSVLFQFSQLKSKHEDIAREIGGTADGSCTKEQWKDWMAKNMIQKWLPVLSTSSS